jgi:hypothetical protein
VTHHVGRDRGFRGDQFVIKHNVGILQRPQRLDGQQIRIARAGADQGHPALRLARHGSAGKSRCVANIFQRRFNFVVAPGQNQRADRAIDHALPEAAAQRKFGNAAMDVLAPAADEANESPIRPAPLRCARARGAPPRAKSRQCNGNHHIAAIDDGGKMKVECARSSITFTGRPTAFARADIAIPMSPAPAQRMAITPRRSAASGSPSAS